MILKEYSFLQTIDKDNEEYPYIKPETFQYLEKFVLENEEPPIS